VTIPEGLGQAGREWMLMEARMIRTDYARRVREAEGGAWTASECPERDCKREGVA